MCLLHFSPRFDIYIGMYLATYLRHFLSHFEIYEHVPTALFIVFRDIFKRTYCTFYHISRYMGTCILQPLSHSKIYDIHAHTALFITFRDIWKCTCCTIHRISRYIGTYLLHFSSHFKIYGHVNVAL